MCTINRTNKFLVLPLTLLLLSLVSCNSKPQSANKDAQFASMFPDIMLGEYLRLATIANGQIPPETTEDDIGIAVVNISDQQIIFPLELSNQNFVYDTLTHEWKQIPEKFHTSGATIILYPLTDLEKEQFSDKATAVKPDLSGYKKPIVVRVLILGEIYQNGASTGQKVGSYIDITFKP